MSPLQKTLLDVLLAVCAVVPPFLLGRALGPSHCKNCARRHAQAADRARHNGEAVARLRERSVSPDDVRRQAAEDRADLRKLLAAQGVNEFSRPIAW